MRKKYGRLRKRENLIVFPGTFEKLVKNGIAYVEDDKFQEAVEAFDQAILYEPEYPEFLVPYSIALYKTRDFIRAKEIADQLLHSGTANFIEAMEMYLTISIQLQHYEEVEMTIDTLIDEGMIPNDVMVKFDYLRELNNRMSKRYSDNSSTNLVAKFTMEEFIEMDSIKQQQTLATLEGADLNPLLPVLEKIAARSDLSPLVITFALTLLQQSGSTTEITVQKFGIKDRIVPSEMTLPGQDDQTQEVLVLVEQLLLKDPSRFELASGIIEKFAITAFPFSWGHYSSQEIASTYIDYIESLFSGEQLSNSPLVEFIRRIDTEFDLVEE